MRGCVMGGEDSPDGDRPPAGQLGPANRAEYVELIRAARARKGWTLRQTGAAAGVPHTTVAGWCNGKHLPTSALTGKFVDLLGQLELVSDDAEREAWLELIASLRTTGEPEESPYVGLRAYGPTDARYYHGRERALAELVHECSRRGREGPLTVIVIGDSGSGKSSLLAAGLVGGATAPGGPLEGLLPVWVEPAALPGFTAPDEACLLLVDQFEEAQKLPPAQQLAVFDALAELPAHAVVVIALTADAFGFVLRDDRLAAHLDTQVRVASLSEQEYRRIIEEPARRKGRSISPALTTLILRDLRQYGEPAPGTVLPLLSSALRQCWETAAGDVLRTDSYLANGGLWGAVDRAAEDAYLGLDPELRPLVRKLMLSLVALEGGDTLRRRIPLDSLPPDLALVADGFVAARLLVRRDGQLSIAHDALLRHWKRLKGWAEEESASLLIGRRVQMATQVWSDAGRATEALLPVEAALWHAWAQQEEAPLLSEQEREFIALSLEQARREEQSQRATIAAMRRRLGIAVVAGVVAGIMALSAFLSSGRANEATAAAQSRQVALAAEGIRPLSPNVAAQLSVAAAELADTVEARSALVRSAGSPLPERATGPAGNTMVAQTGSGAIVRADREGTVTIWRTGSLGAEPESFDSGGGQLFAIALSSTGGRELAFFGGQQTASVWDITDTPRRVGEFGADTVTYSAQWQGATLLFGTLEGQIRRVDLSLPEAPQELPPIDLEAEVAVTSLAATPELVLAGGRAGALDVFAMNDARHLESHDVEGTALAMAISPDGSRLAVGQSGGAVGLWDVRATGVVRSGGWSTPALVTAVLFDDESLLLGGGFSEVRQYDLDGELLRAWPERGVVVSLATRGDRLLIGASDGSISLWHRNLRGELNRIESGRLFDVVRGGSVVMLSGSGGPHVFGVADGGAELPLVADGAPHDLNAYTGFSRDGSTLVNQSRDGQLITFRREGERYVEVARLAFPGALSDIRLSPEGELLVLGTEGRVGYQVYRWTGGNWAEVAQVPGWPSGISAFVDDAVFVGLGVDGQEFTVWDLAAAEPRLLASVATEGQEVPAAFAGAQGRLAIGDLAGAITLYSLEDPTAPKLTARLLGARSSISQVNFSEDGRRLLASTNEGMVWVWRLDAREPELELRLQPGVDSVQGVAELDGWAIISLSDGRTLRWPLPAEEEVSLCDSFGQYLTRDQWEQLVHGVPFTAGCG